MRKKKAPTIKVMSMFPVPRKYATANGNAVLIQEIGLEETTSLDTSFTI